MNKRLLCLLAAVGALLCCFAGVQYALSEKEEAEAAARAERYLLSAQQDTAQEEAEEAFSAEAAAPPSEAKETPPAAGVLEIPALSLRLAVSDVCSEEALAVSPCRQSGSAATGDLVIAGHNYRRHFGSLGQLAPGDEVFFAESGGESIRFFVVKKETVPAENAEAVTKSGYALTLYTCTRDGKERIAVFCDRAESGS